MQDKINDRITDDRKREETLAGRPEGGSLSLPALSLPASREGAYPAEFYDRYLLNISSYCS